MPLCPVGEPGELDRESLPDPELDGCEKVEGKRVAVGIVIVVIMVLLKIVD
jgi:hypothetical protein